jgi:hypothetical protein
MKIIKQAIIIGAVALSFASAIHTYAIEGLKISIQSTNAVLSWPSTNDGSETYIVQYRSNLNASASWLTLTDNLSAASSTNITSFVNSNSVTYPPLVFGGTNGGGSINPNGTNNGSGGTNGFQSTAGFYRVVRDGAHLFGVTNGETFSGVVTIPVEVANGYGSLVNLGLIENDAPVSGLSSQAPPIPLPLQLTVDTTQMSNGVHQISASATWNDTNGGIWEADSPPVTVNVYNEISFPNWMPRFGEMGNSLLIKATSAHTNVDWTIDVYDSQYSYIGTFGGNTPDGDITVAWNLVGPDGVAHTNDSFFIFYVTTPYSDPPTPPTFKVTDPWSGPGGWVGVAQHAFDNITDHDLLYSELGGFVGGAQNVGWQVNPSPYTDDSGNLAPFAINFQNGSEVSDWSTFRSALYNPISRNLVYFGHAGPNSLGYNSSDTNVSISAKEIANMLHTIPDNQTNRHAFRFVFLDGCSSAKGTFPESFGIIHKSNVPIDNYINASMRPSAFVGWDANKTVGFFWNTLFYSHVNFIVHIQEDMLLNSDGIEDAINYAANQPDVSWFLWTSQCEVFGWNGLHFGQYNN